MKTLRVVLACIMLGLLGGTTASAQEDPPVFGDARPDAPELAQRGDFGVGVTTLTFTNPDQLDILSATESTPPGRYARPLTVEVWYPAAQDADARVVYEEVLGVANNPNRPLIPFQFAGRATRDADPLADDGPYPLLIISHGYPGSRLMLAYLAENLASKGYVVVAIDHTDGTFRDVGAFGSTLLNRPLDILFVLDAMATLADDNALASLVDADNTGLIGYSMGGYGAINAAGAGFSEAGVAVTARFGLPGGELAVRQAGNEDYLASADDRIRAVMAFAPWGMNVGLWDADGLAGIAVPLFIVAGDQDDVSGYTQGIRLFYDNAVNAERYLLTLEGARHNVAPHPAPTEAVSYEEYMRYADNVWDPARMNNIMQHFATAFFDTYVKGDEDAARYLDLIENADEGVVALDDAGNPTDEHTYWAGFLPRSAVGLRLEYSPAAE